MTHKTVAQRQQAYRANKKAHGLKELRNLWVHPEDEAELRAIARMMILKRKQLENTKESD